MEDEKEHSYEFNIPEDKDRPRYIASRRVQPKEQEDAKHVGQEPSRKDS